MAIRIAPTSGSTTSPSPDCTIRSMPATGSLPRISLSSSAATRSAVIRPSCGAICCIAAPTRGAVVKQSCETKRAARSIRNGSSPNDTSGADGVSSTLARSAANPPTGSRNSAGPSAVMRTAIALTVKSRRTRSPSRLSPNRTRGLRDIWS